MYLYVCRSSKYVQYILSDPPSQTSEFTFVKEFWQRNLLGMILINLIANNPTPTAPATLSNGVPVEVLHDLHHNSHQEGGYVVRSCVKGTQEKYRKYRAHPKRTA
jgi:hypothetical protein